MNKMLVAVAMALAIVAVHGDTYSDKVNALNPLYYWRMGDQGPAEAGPAMSGNLGTVTHPATRVTPSTTDAGSTSFSNSGVRTAGALSRFPPGSTGYTTCFWVNFASLSGSFNNLVGDGSSGSHWYMMVYKTPGNKIRAHKYPNVYDSASTLTTNTDYFICTQWDMGAGKVRIYINGALDIEHNSHTTAPSVAYSTTGIMMIGRDNREAGPNARIDEVAFWNRALSETEITGMFHTYGGCFVETPGHAIPGYNTVCTPGQTLQECTDLCLADATCKSFDFSSNANPTGTCCTQYANKDDVGNFGPSPSWNYFHRVECATHDPAVSAFCDDIAGKCSSMDAQCTIVRDGGHTDVADDCDATVVVCNEMEQDCRDKAASCPLV